ncbi:MAG: 4-hydroxythreonine-4-phosphate dehydrogenase PdxA [Chitinivibrionales bacterium]|nr:4-hydroxythreonine-4-phosphate dehydrogenase PdxA [Chitinivibrionales bacterium]
MGDPAGIGPEIAVKSLTHSNVHALCRPILIGDAAVIRQTVALTHSSHKVRSIAHVHQAPEAEDVISVYDLANAAPDSFACGEVSAIAGNAAYEAITTAISLAQSGEVDATVTGPINKQALRAAGHAFAGHTEIYAHVTETKSYAMLLADRELRIIHVTTHVPLRKVCDMITRERVFAAIDMLANFCHSIGIKRPRIGVAGLNPHAGDGGLFGNEEAVAIAPAIEQAVDSGYDAAGPVPPDTLFCKAKGGLYDGCVAMYHDQGHIPFKYNGFEWDHAARTMKRVSGVNITLGLPIIRTSVDHGTAFDIAGQGVASEEAMVNAIEYAAKMARTVRA